jgi:hypothetical protein
MYMSKKIEKFIEQNRLLLDTENVPEAVWGKITLPVTEKKQAKIIGWKPLYKWAAAAAVTGILSFSSYIIIQKYRHDNSVVTAGNATTDTLPRPSIETIPQEYGDEAAAIYKSITVKQEELKTIASTEPELYKQFAGDLATLDSSYRVLQSQANTSPNHDVIIKAMIQNLQLQAELLGRQLMIINQFKNSKKESHETKNTIQRT